MRLVGARTKAQCRSCKSDDRENFDEFHCMFPLLSSRVAIGDCVRKPGTDNTNHAMISTGVPTGT